MANDKLVKLIVNFILHGVQFILEVLLLLLEELELPLPVAPAELLLGQIILLLFVNLELVAHDLDHRHSCSICVVSPPNVNHFGEACPDVELIHSWHNLFMKFFHGCISE